MKTLLPKLVALALTLLLLAACDNNQAPATLAMTVYKSPTCGCCADWMTHMRERGFALGHVHPQDLNAIKREHEVPPALRSCHTAVMAEGGYVFEGHVPAPVIRQFLADPPADAIGLAVPGMPLGSPGMEVDERFEPYDVLLLQRDGSHRVYARISAPEQQY